MLKEQNLNMCVAIDATFITLLCKYVYDNMYDMCVTYLPEVNDVLLFASFLVRVLYDVTVSCVEHTVRVLRLRDHFVVFYTPHLHITQVCQFEQVHAIFNKTMSIFNNTLFLYEQNSNL